MLRFDSWGKLLSTSGSLAETFGAEQPFRYRGYVYDEETGWYYLQSRYYNPEVGRFISADVYLSTGQGVLGHNAYAYCLNNPVNCQDGAGCRASWATTVMVYDNAYTPCRSTPPNDYINDQRGFEGSNLPFGPLGNIADNGCGLVALYNVSKAGGLPYTFSELHDMLLSGLGWVGNTNLGGCLGMNPNTVLGFLERNFCNDDVGTWDFIQCCQNFDAVIILYAYFEPTIGAHYFAGINNGDGSYTFYNDASIKSIYLNELYGELARNGELFIKGWGINFNN